MADPYDHLWELSLHLRDVPVEGLTWGGIEVGPLPGGTAAEIALTRSCLSRPRYA